MIPKIRFRKTIVAVATVGLCTANSLVAQEADLAAIFNIDLEVTVASKKAEKISDAPGMIVAYSKEDMKQLNSYTIRDLANVTTGYSSHYGIGEQTLQTRGQMTGGFDNNKHLLMIDGIPVRHVRAGKVSVEEEVSLFGTERVEFMKGPGSALYGTGAFYGVINVVSPSLTEDGIKAGSQISYSTYNDGKQAMAYTAAKNEEGQFSANVSYFDQGTKGDYVRVRGNDGSINDTMTGFRDWNQRKAISLRTSYAHEKSGLTIGMYYSSKTTGLGEYWWQKSSPFNELTWETVLPYLKFNRKLTDKISISSYILGNVSTEKGMLDLGKTELDADGNAIGGAGVYTERARDFEALVEASIGLGNIGDIITGVNYDTRKNIGSANDNTIRGWVTNGSQDVVFDTTVDGSDWFNTISAYAQYQKMLDLLSGLKITAGFREDIGIAGDNNFNQFSPRLGLVQKFTDNLNLKLLYGTALRAPGIKEVGINKGARKEMIDAGATNSGDISNLGAEVISSYEAGINASFSKITASVAGYYNITKNSLEKEDVISDNDSTAVKNVYYNSKGETNSMGIEVDLIAMPIKYIKIRAGGSVMNTYNAETLMEPLSVPTAKLNGSISFMSNTKIPFSITPVLTYTTGFRNGGHQDDNDIIRANDQKFYNADINADVYPVKNIGIGVQVKNVTGNETYIPGLVLGPKDSNGDWSKLDVQSLPRSFKFYVTANF